MTTLTLANRALTLVGAKERLYKGKGYFYFADGDTASWPESMIVANTLAAFDAAEILQEYYRLKRKSSGVGAPAKMEGGRRMNVYLDKVSILKAKTLGDGNVSEGIRKALNAEKG